MGKEKETLGHKPSLLIVLYYYLPYTSGLTEYARRLAESLAADGFRVTVVSSRFDSELPEREWINGVEVRRLKVWSRASKGVIVPSLVPQVVRLAREFDCVQFHLPLPDAGFAAPFIDAKRTVVTYHCDVNLGPGFVNRTIEEVSFGLMGMSLKRAAKIVGNSRAYFEQSRFSQMMDKFIQIYPPIDTSFFVRNSDTGFLREFGVDNDSYKIGFAGRLVYEKGVEFLLEAVGLLGERIPKLQVVLAGDDEGVAGGGIKATLSKFVASNPGKIVFLGNLSQEQIVKFYSEIDVLVLPSIDPLESFGMVQVEAMCCGTPVVASDMPGVNEVVTKSGFGLLAEPRSPSDLAEKIFEIYSGRYHHDGFRREDWDASNTTHAYKQLFLQLATDNA